MEVKIVRHTFISKMLAGERLLKGSPKDFKMVPCRHHSDFIRKVLVGENRMISL